MSFRHILGIEKRRTNYIFMTIDDQPGNDFFTLKFSKTFDGVYGNDITIPQYVGGVSESSTIPDRYVGNGLNNKTCYFLNPVDIGVGFTDLTSFWVTVTTVSGDNSGISLPYLVLPYSQTGFHPVLIRLEAPSGASIVDSDLIQLPFRPESMSIHNNDLGTTLWVGFSPDGDEFSILPSSTIETSTMPFKGITDIYVRGEGSTADITICANINLSGYWNII
jgi:hypothetical protein